MKHGKNLKWLKLKFSRIQPLKGSRKSRVAFKQKGSNDTENEGNFERALKFQEPQINQENMKEKRVAWNLRKALN